MNYIGSKYSLLGFIHDTISNVTGFIDGDNFVFADLFAGTGVVGSFYKSIGCTVLSNDIQYYSYAIVKHYIENNDSVRTDLFDYFNNLPGVVVHIHFIDLTTPDIKDELKKLYDKIFSKSSTI